MDVDDDQVGVVAGGGNGGLHIYEGDGDNDGDDDEDGGHLANIALVHEPAHRVLLVSTLKGDLDRFG